MKKEKISIVWRFTGGICDQMTHYANGLLCEEKGFDFYADKSWYDECGMDDDGIQVRNYDLEVACPSLKVRQYDPAKIEAFKRKYNAPGATIDKVSKSAYIPYYGDLFEWRTHFWKRADVIRQAFHPVDANLCKDILDDMAKQPSCAIHVRRGDLANCVGHDDRVFPCSDDYYFRAMKIVKAYFPNVVFYFFSDGMEFVKEEIIPKLPEGTKYRIVDLFGADKGYLDLYMMTKCDSIVASRGSFGLYAKVLSQKNPLLITPRRVEGFLDRYENCIYLNDDVSQAIKYHVQLQEGEKKKIKFYHKLLAVLLGRAIRILKKRGMI